SIQTNCLHKAGLHLCLVWLPVETSDTSVYHQGENTKPEAMALFTQTLLKIAFQKIPATERVRNFNAS
ncbi:hypothetical protein Nmel_006479, partial [Mimus melanotis]